MAQLLNGNEIVTPTEADAALAGVGPAAGGPPAGGGAGPPGAAPTTPRRGARPPPSALRLLLHALTEMGQGTR